MKRKRIKKQAHAIFLKEAKSDQFIAFHAVFSCYIFFRIFYDNNKKSFSVLYIDREAKSKKSTFFSSISSISKFHRDDISSESINYKQMLKHQHSFEFMQTVKMKIDQLTTMKIWKKILFNKKLSDKISISLTWVFKYKFDDQKYFIKYKARLCAKENLQHTEQNTFAVILAIRIFRTLMIIIAAFNLEIRQYDAINAFTNSEIDESTYCYSFDDWTESKNILLFLLRAFYDLKQFSALWYKHLSRTFFELSLKNVSRIECLFVNEYMILFFFVDDIAIMYDRRHMQKIEKFQFRLFQAYEMKYLEKIQWFLDIRIVWDRKSRKLSFCQNFYINKLIFKFHIKTIYKTSDASLFTEKFRKNIEQAIAEQILAYQQRIEFINFAAVTIKSDIAQAVFKLFEFFTNFSKHYLFVVDRLFRYLIHTKKFFIVFDFEIHDSKTVFLKFSNAFYDDDIYIRHSSQNYCFRLFNDMIDWKISKQKTVIINFIETKLLTISNAIKKLLWWKKFFDSIKFKLNSEIKIQCDNIQTIRVFTHDSSQFIIKFRHVNIHKHWLKQKIQKQTIFIIWISSSTIIVDDLTKTLSSQRHIKFVRHLSLEQNRFDEEEEFDDNASVSEMHRQESVLNF